MARQRISVLVQPLRKLMRRSATGHVQNMLRKLHAADVARLMDFLNEDEQSEVFALTLREAPKRAADLIAELDTEEVLRLFGGLTDSEIASIVNELSSDDAATVVSAMPSELGERILAQLGAKDAAPIEGLLRYEEDTAGRIMSPEVFALEEHTSVQDAISALRSSRAEALEMVFYLYVVDDRQHLVGVCSLRDLLLADQEHPLRDVMTQRVMSVNVHTDQEDVARLVARYNLLALPVVDDENKLVGIVTVDDVIDVIREEESEDILLMAGVGEDEEEVLRASLGRSAWMRLPWLFAAWIGGVLASQVIVPFESMAQFATLAAFIPIVVGMGGNVGTQSATIVVRGLATGRITPGQSWRVVFREIRVALTLGVLFGVLLGVVSPILTEGGWLVGPVLGVSILASMTLAATVGTGMPIILHRLGVDPAIATGPFVTTSIDVIGVLAYLGIARLLLV